MPSAAAAADCTNLEQHSVGGGWGKVTMEPALGPTPAPKYMFQSLEEQA